MASSNSDHWELLDRLAEEFAERYRCGQRPSLQEYVEKYPEQADAIRELFPAMVEMEQVEKDFLEPVEQPATSAAPLPRQVGDYQILREIGRGGMGVVYEAEQQSLRRRVALKILTLNTSDGGKGVERFRREARSAAKLHHTNIVPVFEVEYRTLVRDPTLGKGFYQSIAISPDEGILAAGMNDGFGLWDLQTSKDLAFVALPSHNLVVFEPSGALVSNGLAGLFRWPVQTDLETGKSRIGPPRRLPMPGTNCQVAGSRDGRVLATAQYWGALALQRDHPDQPVRLGPHDDVRYVAVSPEGHWAVTGSHNGRGVKIWDARSGKLEQELAVPTPSQVLYSPDGKWLATTGGGVRLWAAGSWREGPRITTENSGVAAFSRDSKIVAAETGHGTLLLVDPATGREYARLEDPNQDRAGSVSFSPDGTQLVTTSNDSQAIHVWDLRSIRRQLAAMSLDWDLPAYPEPSPSKSSKPVQVMVDLGILRSDANAPIHQPSGDLPAGSGP